MEDRTLTHETDIAVLKNDVHRMAILFQKLETAIEKIGDVSNSIGQMLAVHEAKINKSEQTGEELFSLVEKRKVEAQEDVKGLHSRITTVSRELSSEVAETEKRLMSMLSVGLSEIKTAITADHKAVEEKSEKVNRRLDDLEKWRWLVVGGSIVIGAVVHELLSLYIPK